MMQTVSKQFTVKIALGIALLFPILFLAQSVYAANIIAGRVYDKQRNFVINVDVELLDEYYRVLKRTRTDGVGFYQFDGLNNGNYTVRVLPYRYDLEDQSQYIEIASVTAIPGQIGSSYNSLDFYLMPKKGGLKEVELSVIFAQEIPKEAEKLYEKAVKDLSEKRTNDGIIGLREAIKIFPNYYLALHRFGLELFIKRQYKDSVPAFLKAVQVNQKSATSYYYLGFALHNLGKEYNKSAFASLSQAVILAPGSPQVLWLLGKVERNMGKYTDAEKHLLQAKELSVNKVPEIHMELAQLYSNELKKYKEAADELELYIKASRLNEDDEKKMKKMISDLREKVKKTQS